MLLSINHAERGFDYLMPWSLGCNFDSKGNLKEKQYDIQTDLLKYQLVLEKDINSQRRQSEILFPPSPPIYAKNEKWGMGSYTLNEWVPSCGNWAFLKADKPRRCKNCEQTEESWLRKLSCPTAAEQVHQKEGFTDRSTEKMQTTMRDITRI